VNYLNAQILGPVLFYVGRYMSENTGDLVAYWDVPLSDQNHRIEFEHGTITGKRIVRVDGNEIFRRDWMFKLIGSQEFTIGRAKCIIQVCIYSIVWIF